MCCVIFFTVVESHPDNTLEDLRLDKPFPELREHIQSYDLDQMDKKVGEPFALRALRQTQTQNRDSMKMALGRLLLGAELHLSRGNCIISHQVAFLASAPNIAVCI